MNKEKLLKKIIKKAEDNGWEESGYDKDFVFKYDCPEIIIFSHSFCKAYFESGFICKDCKTGHQNKDKKCDSPFTNAIPVWQHHITQLALAKDRLEYLYLIGGSLEALHSKNIREETGKQ